MSDHFRPSGREVLTDLAVSQDVAGEGFQNRQFVRLFAKDKKFTNCDFSHSQFDSAYLRNCTFDSCKFVGCKFVQSNLRGSKFEGCVFDYAEFSYTQVDPEIIGKGCPGHESLQEKFARTLRVNFHQIGDSTAANEAIKVELEATKIHLYKAWRSRESYYRKNFCGTKRVSFFFKWLGFVLFDLYWGNGESLLKLFRSLALFVLLIAIYDAIFIRDPVLLRSYWAALVDAPQVLLGISQPAGFSAFVLALVAGFRFITFACLVSVFVKRFSRR